MNSLNPVYVDIDDFARDANTYYDRAQKGERIIITVNGEPQNEIFTDADQATSVLNELPRPCLTQEEFLKLIDILDPLDKID